MGCKSVGGLTVQLEGPSDVVITTTKGSAFADVILMAGVGNTRDYGKVAAAAARLEQDYGTWSWSDGGSTAALQLDTAAIAGDCASIGYPTGSS